MFHLALWEFPRKFFIYQIPWIVVISQVPRVSSYLGGEGTHPWSATKGGKDYIQVWKIYM